MELNIYQKLAKIGEMVDVIKKEKSGFNYKYTDIAEILARVKLGMKKYGISLIPSILHDTTKVDKVQFEKTKVDRTTKQPYNEVKVEMVVTADTNMRWVDNENPESYIDVPWVVTGCQEDPSQALGSALTYCERQFLQAFFHIATVDNDVDTYRSKQKEAEAAENRAIVEEIIKEIDSISKEYVANSSDMDAAKAQLLGVTSKYVKGGNYNKIDNASLAAKLLQECQEKFIVKEN